MKEGRRISTREEKIAWMKSQIEDPDVKVIKEKLVDGGLAPFHHSGQIIRVVRKMKAAGLIAQTTAWVDIRIVDIVREAFK